MDLKKFVSNTLNSIPVVGHAKGLAHHMCGDPRAGNEAFMAATRSTAVIGAAAVTGGVGVIPVAMAYDTIESIVTNEPRGYVLVTKNLVDNPSASSVLDATLTVAGDVASGYTGAKGLKNIVLPKSKGKDILVDVIKVSDAVCKGGQKYLINEAIQNVTTKPMSKMLRNQSRPQMSYYKGDSSDEEDRRGTRYSHEYSEESSDEEDTDEEDDLEDAYAYDDYEEDTHLPLSEQEKRNVLQNKMNQKPKDHLPSNIRSRAVSITTETELEDSMEKFKSLDPDERSNGDDENLWRRPAWLPVVMPRTFNYTGAVVTNILQQGLLHMVIRHGNQIEDHISEFQALFKKLPQQIRYIIRDIQNARSEPASRAMTNRLEQALQQLGPQTAADTDEILYELQMAFYKYLKENVVLNGYLGEGCNNRSRQTVFFKVKDLEGRTQVMVICVSDELRENPGFFGNDTRPVRSIITCYFISWDVYIQRLVCTLFERD